MSNSLKIVTWEDARKDLALINPAITAIIDQMSPSTDLYLYEASYAYGEIIDNGEHFNFPDETGKLYRVSEHNNQSLVDDFQYAGDYIPIGIITQKCVELFIDAGDTIIPSQIFCPGDVFALALHLEKNKSRHPTPITQMASGCRSCFSLPNISDSIHYMQLKRKLNLKSPLPKSLYEQWDFFRNIVKARKLEQPWQAKALLFPQKWVELIKHDPDWQPLYCHLIELAWLKSSYLRNKIYYDYSFNMVTTQRNIKPNPYVAETFKYIIAIALGEFPGFRVGVDDSALPISVIQEALLNDYALKHYIPTIIHAARFDFQSSPFAAYYSFQFPSVPASVNKAKRLTTTLHDLRELKYIFDHYHEAVTQQTTGLHETVIGQMLESTALHFLHSKKDIHNEINLSNTVDTFDPHFHHCSVTINEDKTPSYAGAFLRGCIGITNNHSAVPKST